MLVHDVTPDSMLAGTMVSIPKGNISILTCSDNYRAITRSSIVGKVFDWVVLIKEHSALSSSDLQFGFTEHVSTTQGILVMSEIISYYNASRSNVYCVLLYTTKAFDRVNYCKLFRKLLDKDMTPLVLSHLFYLYTNQSLQVRWGNHTSAKFSCKNGVKPDGVLSPILFSVYIDGIFEQLRVSGIGCRIGNQYTGGLVYDDDLTLMGNLSYIFAKIMLMSMMYYLIGQKVNL